MDIFDKAKKAMKNAVYFFIPMQFLRNLAEKIKADSSFSHIEYPPDLDYENRQVLIGVLRNKAQLDTALRDNFYHIPCYLMENEKFPIKYVAIYQSKSLFGKNAGIRYYGEIDSVTPVIRKDIKEIPSDKNEYYYYVKIKSWKRLDKTIKAKEAGFLKETTTYYQLLHALELPELLLRSKSEVDTYFKIKAAVKLKEKAESIQIGNCVLKFMKNRIAVFRQDEVYFTETYDGFGKKPLNFIKKISDD